MDTSGFPTVGPPIGRQITDRDGLVLAQYDYEAKCFAVERSGVMWWVVDQDGHRLLSLPARNISAGETVTFPPAGVYYA